MTTWVSECAEREPAMTLITLELAVKGDMALSNIHVTHVMEPDATCLWSNCVPADIMAEVKWETYLPLKC